MGFAGPVGMKEKIPIFADRDVEHIRQRRHRRQRGRHAPDGRQSGPRFPARRCSPISATPSTATLARAAAPSWPCGTPSRWATCSSWARNIPRPCGARFLDANEQLHADHHGLLRHRHQPHHRRADRDHHDNDGIIWPVSLAPYEVLLAPVNVTDAADAGRRRLHDRAFGRGRRRAAGRPRRPGRA